MHCTVKKTTQLILEDGNGYIVTVKGNQPRLLAQLETLAQQTQPEDRFVDVEKTRGRITCRIVNRTDLKMNEGLGNNSTILRLKSYLMP